MPFVVRSRGTFRKTRGLLRRGRDLDILNKLSEYGQKGVIVLSEATPFDTGNTANSWGYEITVSDGSARISWTNSNVEKGYANIAILLQMGHATATGGWVEGIDYINPALQPIFDKLADDLWKEVRDV